VVEVEEEKRVEIEKAVEQSVRLWGRRKEGGRGHR
jgi:hypothetical protein